MEYVTVEIIENSQDLCIVPVCSVKTDTIAPEISDRTIAYGSEKLKKNNISLDEAKYDLNGNLILDENSNKGNKLIFDIFATDNDKPSKILIHEIPVYINSIPEDLENPGDSLKEACFTNCFNQVSATLYEAEIEYSMQTNYANLFYLEIFVMDESGNVCQNTRKYVVNRISMVSDFSIINYVEENDNNSSEEKRTYSLSELNDEVKTIWLEPINDINEYFLSWGHDENCSLGSAVIKSNPTEEINAIYYSDSEPKNKYTKYKLPDSLFETDGNIFLRIYIEDSIGNSREKLLSFSATERIYLGYDQDSSKLYFEASGLKRAFYSAKDSDQITEGCLTSSNGIFLKFEDLNPDLNYSEAKYDDVLGYLYYQTALFVNEGGYFASRLTKVPVIKGHITGEPNQVELNINKEDFYKITEEVNEVTGESKTYYTFSAPEEFAEYKWKFYTDASATELIEDKIAAEGFYFVKIIAYNSSDQKVYETNIYFERETSSIPNLVTYKEYNDNSIIASGALCYFTNSNYAGSGIKLIARDEIYGLLKDNTGKAFIDIYIAPQKDAPYYFSIYKLDDSLYPTYRIYERPYEYKTDKISEFAIPLYTIEENKIVNVYTYLKNGAPDTNTSEVSAGVFNWNRLNQQLNKSVENGKINLSFETDLSEYETEDVEYSEEIVTYVVEKWFPDKNAWLPVKNDYIIDSIKSETPNNAITFDKATGKITVSDSIDTVLPDSENAAFYRARVTCSFLNGSIWQGGYNHNYYTTPLYFYNVETSVNEELCIQGINGIQISLNQPTLVQTYCSSKNLGSRLSEWELQAQNLNTAFYTPESNGSTAIYYYDQSTIPAAQVPEGYFFTTAIYFANGKSTHTPVMEK